MSFENDEQGLFYTGEVPRVELEVSPALPEFDKQQSPVINIELKPYGRLRLHHLNTAVFQYSDEYEIMDHIRVTRKKGAGGTIFFFPNLLPPDDNRSIAMNEEATIYDGKFGALVDRLWHDDFPFVELPSRPSNKIMNMYYGALRKDEPIDHVPVEWTMDRSD